MLTVTLLAAEGGLPPWVLIPVFWIWVNTHGSFPLGLVALGALWLGRRADKQDGVGRAALPALRPAVGTVLGRDQPARARAAGVPRAPARARWTCCATSSSGSRPRSPSAGPACSSLQIGVAVVLLVRRPVLPGRHPAGGVHRRRAARGAQRRGGQPSCSCRAWPGASGTSARSGGEQRTPVSAVRGRGRRAARRADGADRRWPSPPSTSSTFPVAPVAWIDQHGLQPTPICPWPPRTRPATTSSSCTAPGPRVHRRPGRHVPDVGGGRLPACSSTARRAGSRCSIATRSTWSCWDRTSALTEVLWPTRPPGGCCTRTAWSRHVPRGAQAEPRPLTCCSDLPLRLAGAPDAMRGSGSGIRSPHG